MALNYAEALYALDDSSLDVYQSRVWLRVLRRGVCFESQRNMADSIGMSLGKVNQALQWLLENGWIVRDIDERTQKVGYVAVIPDEQAQQNLLHDMNIVLPDERGVLPDERHLKAKELKEKTTAVAREAEKQTDSAFVFYENNIGGMTPRISEWIQDAIGEYGESRVIEAMDEAVLSNVRRWKYVKAILESWKQNGRGKPLANGNGRHTSPSNGTADDKAVTLENIRKAVTVYGAKKYKQAMATLKEPEKAIVKKMAPSWRDVCMMDANTFQIRYYQALKGA